MILYRKNFTVGYGNTVDEVPPENRPAVALVGSAGVMNSRRGPFRFAGMGSIFLNGRPVKDPADKEAVMFFESG